MDFERLDLSTIKDLDLSILLDIDVASVSAETLVEGATSVSGLLRLEDLDYIDWSLVSSYALGWADIIGQLLQPLSGILTGFVDTIKGAFEAIAKPIRDVVDRIWGVVSGIPGTLSSIVDTLRGVVLKPIGDFLDWVARNLPALADVVRDVLTRAADFIMNLPAMVRDIASRVGDLISDIATRASEGFRWLLEQITRLPDVVRVFIDIIARIFSDLADRVRAGFSWFLEQVGKLPDLVRGFIDRVAAVFSELADRVRAGFTWFLEQVARLPDTVRELVSRITAVFTDLADKVRAGFAWLLEQIGRLPDAIRGFIDFVARVFSELADRIRGGFAWFVEQVAKIPDIIRDFIGRAGRLFAELADRIRSGFAWFIEQVSRVPDIIRDFIGRVAGFFADLADRVRAGFAWFIEQVSRVPELIRALLDSASKLFSDFVDRVRGGVAWFIEQMARLADMARELAGGVASVFADLADKVRAGLLWFIEQYAKLPLLVRDVLSSIVGDIAAGVGGFVEWVRRGFDTVSSTLSRWFESARSWFEEATRVLRGVATALEVGFQGFVNVLMKIPERLAEIFKGVADFYANLWRGLQEFARDPLGWFKKNLLEPLWRGLLWLGERLWEGLKALWDIIRSGLQWLWERLVDLFTTLKDLVVRAFLAVAESLSTGLSALFKAFKGLGEKLYGWYIEVVEWVGEGLGKAVDTVAKRLLEPLWRAVGWSTPPGLTLENFVKAWSTSFMWSIPLYIFALSVEIPLRLASFAARGVAMALRDHTFKIRLTGKPFGVGGDFEFDLFKAIGSALYNFSEELLKHADKYYEPFWTGLMFWYGRYTSQILTFYLRNFIPIEFPTVNEVVDAYLRSRVAEAIPQDLGRKPSDILEVMTGFMKIKGFSDYLIRWTFAEPEEFYMAVEDRFGVKRKIPLAAAWRIPPPADLITMMIRDVIIKPQEFEKAVAAVGYAKHVAALYYMLHFKYPSPEKLADFYWRGIAGVLWYGLTLEEPEIKSFFEITKRAKAPKELNFDAKTLNDMMLRYLKWHDLAPFPWENGYPTDKSIVADLMADLPDKVDFRWMARWGILEHLSRLGIGMKTSIENIIASMSKATGRETIAEKVSPEISLDVSLLARFLEARGVHPYFASISAVAEMHVALTDEMTLLRTGFLEMFRTGLIDLDTAEKLMSGIFTIKFTTGYIDPATGDETKIEYKKPLFWLPAERRLLQLRAVMDRGYEMWRMVLREVSFGVARLALTVGDARKILEGYATAVSNTVSRQVKELTGVDWTPSLDKSYMELWLGYGEILRVVEARTWIRHYITRLMAWILYRTSYGWVKPDDIKELVDQVAAKGWLVGEEADFFKLITEKIIGIVKRETIPTALTLATMAEYMVIDDATIDRVFEDQRVVEEYRDLYRLYIKVKPFKPDFKALINRARRALVLGAISRDEWDSLKKEAVERFGFRDVEIAILERLAELEERIAMSREYAPTPSTIATLSEYLTIPRELIEEALKARRIPVEWAKIWLQYIAVKPLKSDYKAVISAALKAFKYNVVAEDEWKKVLEEALRFGFTEQEVKLLEKRALYELLVEEAREWRPTILTLISIIEHVPEAAKLLEHYKIDPMFKPVIERYAYVRPLIDEVRVLINALYRAKRYVAVPKELEEKALSIVKQFGVTDQELAIRDLALELQVLVDEARAWLPSPASIATLAEYVAIPRELIEEALKARKVPSEWASIWLQYIAVRPLKADYKAVISAATRAFRYRAIAGEELKKVFDEALKFGFTPQEVELLEKKVYYELLVEEAREWRPSLLTLISIVEYVPEAIELLKHYRVDPVFRPIIERYAYVKPLADEVRVLVNALYRAKRYVAVPKELEEKAIALARQLGVTDHELLIRDLALELQVLVDEYRVWLPSPTTIATLAEYVAIPRGLVEDALKARRVPEEWLSIWLQYIAVRPLKADYRSVLATALRALRYRAIAEEHWKKLLDEAAKYGFTKPEVELLQLRAELELMIEEAREYVPTPSMLATMAEYMPEVRDFIEDVLEARRVRGVWAQLWAKYIYLRPVFDEVRRWASAMFALVEYMIMDVKQLEPVFKVLMIYGWEELEIDIATRTILAEQVRRAFNYVLGAPRTIATMSRYTDKAADWAYTRAARLIEALPVDNNTKSLLKEMWREYIMSYQAYPEIRSYMTELINAYAYGVLDDKGLEDELSYLRKLGVPELRLALVKRTAMLRRVRYAARYG